MENNLHFIKDSTTYNFVGQPDINYYDLSLNSLDKYPCEDILEKTRLLYALWERFTTIDTSNHNGLLPTHLLIDLKKYFEQYQAPDFAYWALLEFETLEKELDQFCSYELETATGNLVLLGSGIKIIMPEPFENLIGKDEFGNLDDVDESNFLDFKLLAFTQYDSSCPIIFMSDKQKLKNEIKINKYYEEIISIFKKHQFNINNCEDLVNIYYQN